MNTWRWWASFLPLSSSRKATTTANPAQSHVGLMSVHAPTSTRLAAAPSTPPHRRPPHTASCPAAAAAAAGVPPALAAHHCRASAPGQRRSGGGLPNLTLGQQVQAAPGSIKQRGSVRTRQVTNLVAGWAASIPLAPHPPGSSGCAPELGLQLRLPCLQSHGARNEHPMQLCNKSGCSRGMQLASMQACNIECRTCALPLPQPPTAARPASVLTCAQRVRQLGIKGGHIKPILRKEKGGGYLTM